MRPHFSQLAIYCLLAAIALLPTIFATDGEAEGNYIRFVEDDDRARLQTAVVHYSAEDGTTLDVIGAVHIGDEAYYKKLNETFEGYDALLYEMVGGDPDKPPTKEDLQKNKKNSLRFFQLLIAGMMKLQFQLDGIDYTAENFVHADMDLTTFTTRQKEKGESIMSLLEKSLEAQQKAAKEGKPNFDMGAMMRLLNNVSTPDGTKLAFGRQFHNIEGMIAGMEGPDGSVLVGERNVAALIVLERERKAGKKKLALFYGAAHMPDFDKRLRAEHGFKRDKITWLTAWDVDKKAALGKGEAEKAPAPELKEAA